MLYEDIDEQRGSAVLRANQDVRLMSGKPAVNKALPGYLDSIQVEHADDTVRQAAQQKVASVVFLRKDGVEKAVMGIVQFPHTLYDG